MKNFIKTKWFTLGTYLLLVLATLLVGFVLLQNNKTLNNVITSFFEVAENRAFDYRQVIKVMHKQPLPSRDIVVLAIDDASLEMLWDKYGEWPVPRSVYADVINYIEKANPKSVIFDLMFIKSMRASLDADTKLIQAMNKYNNIYTAMNFDNQSEEVRKSEVLPNRLAIELKNESNVNIERKYSFKNCRLLLKELINGNVKIGMTNVIRNSDGIIRKVAPIMEYKGKYYPYLSFNAGKDFLISGKENALTIDKNSNLSVGNTVIPLTSDGEAILNWYGVSGTHTVYPMYKLIRDMENGETPINLKNKIN